MTGATHRAHAAGRIAAARRIGADVAAPELWGTADAVESDEITVVEAARRLELTPDTVRGYLRGTAKRAARLARSGGGVSAASVEAYDARRKAITAPPREVT